MPMGEQRWFFEETQLIGTPAMELSLLERRLAQRLAADGVRSVPAGGVERCRIPMDPALPRLEQQTLGFGASASLVHPATGYLLMRTLRAAAPVAEVLGAGLRAHKPVRDVVRDAWEVLWPASQRDAAAMFRFGARTLLAMDREGLGSFYRAFFSISENGWRAYLSGELPADELARVMLAVFGACGPSLQLRLASQGLRDPGPLLRGVRRMVGV